MQSHKLEIRNRPVVAFPKHVAQLDQHGLQLLMRLLLPLHRPMVGVGSRLMLTEKTAASRENAGV
jgi:hypothetical protein